MASSTGIGSILKYAALALGIYFIWKSGILQNLMASISGGAPAVAPPAAGTAATGGGGATTTGAGSSNAPSTTVTTPPTGATTPAATPADILALAQALDARARADHLATGTKILYPQGAAAANWPAGQVLYTVWQWNYIFKELHPAGKDYNSSDNSRQITALQYATERAPGVGLAGLGAFVHAMRGRAVVLVRLTPELAQSMRLRAAQGDLMAAIQLAKAGVPFRGRE